MCLSLLLLGGGHRYSWILLDTDFFGYLANFWDPSIQVSKKKHVFTPNFLTLGTKIDTFGYSWILLDTDFLDTWQIFGIQVSKYPKKNMFLRQTS